MTTGAHDWRHWKTVRDRAIERHRRATHARVRALLEGDEHVPEDVLADQLEAVERWLVERR